MIKNLPAMQETWARFLSWEYPLEEGMVTHSSILAWRIPMDRGAWQATVHGAAKSRTQLFSFTLIALPHDSPFRASPGLLPHYLLPRIFPTQGSNPGLPHCRQILYHLSHQGSPRILEWVAYPFSRGSSQPRSLTRVSCIGDGFFTS